MFISVLALSRKKLFWSQISSAGKLIYFLTLFPNSLKKKLMRMKMLEGVWVGTSCGDATCLKQLQPLVPAGLQGPPHFQYYQQLLSFLLMRPTMRSVSLFCSSLITSEKPFVGKQGHQLEEKHYLLKISSTH